MYEQGDLEGGAGSHSHAIAWEETITDNLFPPHSEPSTLTFAVPVFFFFFFSFFGHPVAHGFPRAMVQI